MRRIVKQREPAELTAHRRTQVGVDYDNAPKEPMRKALLAEQESLCAYCMKQIELGAMKIEHHTAQTVDASRALEWSNLLGVCEGGEKGPRTLQTCDTRKGNAVVSLNPTHERLESQVKYGAKDSEFGAILATDPRQQGELDDTLGLNSPLLIRARRAEFDQFRVWMKARAPESGNWTATDYERALDSYRRGRNGRVRGYIGIVEWFVREKRRKAG